MLAAATLGRIQCEELVGEQPREQIRLDLAGFRPAPAFVERRSEMTLSPGIEQQVAWAAIEAAGGPARREISEIADAADVTVAVNKLCPSFVNKLV